MRPSVAAEAFAAGAAAAGLRRVCQLEGGQSCVQWASAAQESHHRSSPAKAAAGGAAALTEERLSRFGSNCSFAAGTTFLGRLGASRAMPGGQAWAAHILAAAYDGAASLGRTGFCYLNP